MARRHAPSEGGVFRLRASGAARLRPRQLVPAAARWDETLGEYILDWDDVRAAADPHVAALEFAGSAFRHACLVCGWDADLAASAEGRPPPIR